MESATKFPTTLRASYRGTKMFLRRDPSAPAPSSLRTRAMAALALSKATTSTAAAEAEAAAADERRSTTMWLQRFDEAVRECHSLILTLGLSVMDREYIDAHLVHGVPLGKLPILDLVNSKLRKIAELSSAMTTVATRRAKCLERLKRTCAFGGGRAGCSAHMHEKLSTLLQELDAFTIEIMQLVREWREYFQFPVPFLHDGENVLLCFADQYAVGSPISLANGHLRTTSRYSPFFYASPFDAVASGKTAPSFRDAVALWNDLVLNELQRQRESVHEQLAFARMGLYHCVLRLPRDVLHTAGMKPGLLVHINDKNRKQLLVSCLASAYAMLLRMKLRGGGSIASIAGLATFSTKALHLQYFRRWIEWVSARREKREAAASFVEHVRLEHIRVRFYTWIARVDLERERALRWKPFLAKCQMHLLRVYTQRWFMFHSIGNIARSVRRALYLQYFHRFHHLVVKKRIDRHFEVETYRALGGRYPERMPLLHAVGLLKHAAVIPSVAAVVVARAHVVARRDLDYDETVARFVSVTLEEWGSWLVAVSEAYLATFEAVATEMLQAAFPATP